MNKIKKTFQSFTLFVALTLLSTTLFAQSTYKADPAHAKIAFSTVHNAISDVDGIFNSFDATIKASKADFSDAVFDLTVDVKSIDTEVKMRDDHLKSADFFDAEKFTTITFKTTSVEKDQGENRYILSGDLTIHGVTKALTMDLWYRGTITDAQSGNEISGFQVTGVLNRLDFGVGTKIPEALVSNAVQIKADGEFIKQK
ncbi:MAG: YceI family protein [Sphingobacterium sp.]